MINTKVNDTELLEAEFYSKPFKFSYSSMSKLITAPSVFYKEYILKEREDEFKKYLLEGILIHFLVLENQNFDDKFLVMPDSLPSSNSITVIDKVYEMYKEKDDPSLILMDFSPEIDNILTDMKLHQNVKDQAKRIAKIVEPKGENYFEFLKKKQGRTIIDSELLDKCTRRAEIVRDNECISELLGLNLVSDGKNYGVYNELPLEIEAEEGKAFGYKGIVDNVVVDVKAKTVRINDFKTTSKSLVDFPESVEYWNYWLQAVIYLKLVQDYLDRAIDNTWSVEFRFIVFDRHNQLYAFPVRTSTLEDWKAKFMNVEKEAEYHYNSKDFTLPYKYAQGIVNL